MSKTKKIECQLKYGGSYISVLFLDYCEEFMLQVDTMKAIAPALCKGLRPGQSRKLILTQTKNGIKLERAKP